METTADVAQEVSVPAKALDDETARKLIENSIAASLSAIEIYNKPNFLYRNEVFCILIVNAWELLFKAKLLADNNYDIKSIHVFDNQGKQKRLYGVTEVVDEMNRENTRQILVLIPLVYLNYLTESELVETQVLDDNGELAIVLAKAK